MFSIKSSEPSISNRGFQFGDGIFETIAIRHTPLDKHFLHVWSYHFKRIQAGCRALGFAVPKEEQLLDILQSYSQNSNGPCIVKLIFTRMPNRRHEPLQWGALPEVFHCSENWPQTNPLFTQAGVALKSSSVILSQQPLLAGIKHLNRLEYILASQKLCKNYPEHLMYDQSGLVIEGTKTNLFCCIDDQWITPELDQVGVAGVARAILLELLNQRTTVKIGKLPRESLLRSSEMFICNSIIGIWPVHSVDNMTLAIGNTTRQCQHELKGIFQTCA